MEGLSKPGNSRFPDKTRLMGKYEFRMLIKQGITPRRTLKGNRSRGPLYEKRYFHPAKNTLGGKNERAR